MSGVSTLAGGQGLRRTYHKRQLPCLASAEGVSTLAGGQGFKKTYYKRQLPCPPAIAFASAEGRQVFAEALAEGHMNGFFRLMEQFSTQDEPAYCGLASLAMVLNALAIDPRRTWKGAWRWFHEHMLDCCRPLAEVKERGITLPQAACLARCNGAKVELHRYGSVSLGQFRQQVMEVCSSGEEHLVVSYSRKPFLQTGDGHFSPIGGYHAARDLVLILDVARFKYPPHWVSIPTLFEAMRHPDPVTGLPRGFLRLSAQPLLDSVLLTLDVQGTHWQPARHFVRNTAPHLVQTLSAQPGATPHSLLTALLHDLPLESMDQFLVVRQQGGPTPRPSPAPSPMSAQAPSPPPSAPSGPPPPPAPPQTPGPPPLAPTPAAACRSSAASLSAEAVASGAEAAAEAAGGAAGSGTPRAAPLDAAAPPQAPASASQDPGATLHPATQAAAQGPAVSSGAGRGAAEGGGPHPGPGLERCVPQGARQQLLVELRVTPLFKAVAAILPVVMRPCAIPAAPCHPQHTHPSPVAPAPPASSGQTPECAPSVCGGASRQAGLDQSSDRSPAQAGQEGTGVMLPAFLAEKVTLLLLLGRPADWPVAWGDAEAGAQWLALLDVTGMSIVEAELAFLREQWAHIDEVLQGGDLEARCGSGCSQKLDCAALGHASAEGSVSSGC
ncbi:Phytochelatin synthase-domain-containing protein [Haematococcus lacustris]